MKPAVGAFALVLLLGVAALVVPSRPADAQDLTGMYGGILRMALLQAPGWDPLSTNAADATVHNLVWDTLARADPATSEPTPWAAQSWTANQVAGTNNGTITVTLRPGLMWSDNTPVTAADVAYTFGPARYGFAATASGNTVVFTFTDPDGPSGPALGGAGRFFTEVLFGSIAWKSTGTIAYSGMFSRDATNTSRLLANTHHWAGRPYLDAVYLVVASSLDDAACQMLKKRVDFLGFPLLPTDLSDERTCAAYGGWTDVDGNPLNKSLVNPNGTRSEPHVSAVHHPGPRFLYYWMNVAGGGVMGDVNLRRAVYLFVNKQGASAVERYPVATISHSLIGRDNAFWYQTSWEVARDAGYTAIDGRQTLNPTLGIAALEAARYLDVDGDGWRDTPMGQDFALRVGSLAFLGSPEIKKATIAKALVDTLREQGVNATHVEFTSWAALRAAVNAGSLDMALDVADAATVNPRFLESFDPMLDANDPNTMTHVNLGKNSFTAALRSLHFNHVTYYNSLCACVLPVLHYQTQEVYDRDAFTGWVSAFGGVANVWSFASLHRPVFGPIFGELTALSATVLGGQNTTVAVVARDESGNAVAGATVDLSASGGQGAFASATGTTDSNGRFETEWQAPLVGEDLDVTISAAVTKAQYAGATETLTVTARAPYRPLEVQVTVGASRIDFGNSTPVQVLVLEGGRGLPNVGVVLSVSLPGGELGTYSGTTDGAGYVNTTFLARPTASSIYRIDVTASRAGYTTGTGTVSVLVTPRRIDPSEYDTVNVTQNVPGFEVLLVLAALGAAVLVLRWRNRREG